MKRVIVKVVFNIKFIKNDVQTIQLLKIFFDFLLDFSIDLLGFLLINIHYSLLVLLLEFWFLKVYLDRFLHEFYNP